MLYSPTLCQLVVQARREPTFLSVIDARTGLLRGSSDSEVWDFAIAPDGRSIAAAGERSVELVDVGLETSRCAVDAPLTSIALSGVGTPLIAVADTSSAVTVVAASNGVRLARKPIPGTIAATVFADNGQAVAAGGSNGVRLFSIVGDRSWKVDGIGAVNALAAVGPGGEWIATAAGRAVALFASDDGHARWPTPNTHPQSVTRIASSRDGTRIATGCVDRKTRVLDALTGAETFSVAGDGKVQAVIFEASGSLLATANEDGIVVLIDAATASERGRITRPIGCSQIAFSLDATMLAAAWDDNTVSIFDLAAGVASPAKVQELTFDAPISGLAFNPADNTLAVGTAAATIAVHDARSGIELARILHPAPARHFAFSADGTAVATTCDDGSVRVWTTA